MEETSEEISEGTSYRASPGVWKDNKVIQCKNRGLPLCISDKHSKIFKTFLSTVGRVSPLEQQLTAKNKVLKKKHTPGTCRWSLISPVTPSCIVYFLVILIYWFYLFYPWAVLTGWTPVCQSCLKCHHNPNWLNINIALNTAGMVTRSVCWSSGQAFQVTHVTP